MVDFVAKLVGGHVWRKNRITIADARIEIALLPSSANQFCAGEPAKYFCNKIGISWKWRLSHLAAALGFKADSDKPSIGMFMSSRPS
jgi:hypothetical protein